MRLPLPEPPLARGAVTLRPWEPGDDTLLLAAWADEAVVTFVDGPAERTGETARRWIAAAAERRDRGLALDLVVVVAGVPAGEVGLFHVRDDPARAEMGWWLLAAHRGSGHATVAVDLLAGWALDVLGLDQVWARTAVPNRPGAAVARRAGFDLLGERAGALVWARTREAGRA